MAVTQHIGGHLGGHECHASAIDLAEARRVGQAQCLPAYLAYLRAFFDRDGASDLAAERYAHLVIATRVPRPGALSSSKASTSRREPDRPRPVPRPEVQPSVNACLRSGMPGPWSTNSRRTPLRIPSRTVCQFITPPPP